MQWNIERGYKFDEIVQTLKILDADILLLQEIDVGCDRSGRRDVGVWSFPSVPWLHSPACMSQAALSPARSKVTSPAPGRK